MKHTTEAGPRPVSEEEVWIVNNIVTGIKVEYRQTGSDTADTYVHLTNWSGKTVCWKEGTFKAVADLSLGYNYICQPKPGLREAVKARLDWEKKNDYEFNLYKKLKEKYGS